MTQRYPHTVTVPHSDDYHGTIVDDPYRWLEANADSEEVASWIREQNELTRQELTASRHRGSIMDRLEALWDYGKAGAPWQVAGKWFQFRNSGMQNQDVLWLLEHPTDTGRVLLDPNSLAKDGSASLSATRVSPDGRHLAYGVNWGGSDWTTWHVLEIDTGRQLPDEVRWSRFSGATWLPDSSGFLYSRYPEPPEGQEYVAELGNATLRLHLLGTHQADDEIVYSRPDDPKLGFHTTLSDDDRWLVLSLWRGTEARNQIWYRDLSEGVHGAFKPLISEFRAAWSFLGNDGERFYFQTDDQAELSRIVAINLHDPGSCEEVIPEQPNALEATTLLRDRFITIHLEHGAHLLTSWDLTGKQLGTIGLPGIGSVSAGRSRRKDEQLYFTFMSFLEPGSIYRTDGEPGEALLVMKPDLDFAAADYETVQEFATSRDGTRVPLFITRKRGTRNDGSNRVLLYGYGGFNVNMTPVFSVSRLAWLEHGGVLVTTVLRGGAEYGKAWHEGGILDRKQNVFDDFIACAEHLVETGLTVPERLAIQGGSNGGLLVGACMTQRPELFGAAHVAVGVLDMLRYHRFTIGWAWASDYGTSEDEGQFRTLHAYSPLHNVRAGTCYPATLITTGDRDDRVVPAHSFKFTAALQAAQACDRPILLRVQTNTGHGHGKPTRLLIEEQADIWSFLLEQLEDVQEEAV